MSFNTYILCINVIVFIISSISIAPIESNEPSKGLSDFATEFYEVIKKKSQKEIQLKIQYFALNCSNVQNRGLAT